MRWPNARPLCLVSNAIARRRDNHPVNFVCMGMESPRAFLLTAMRDGGPCLGLRGRV
jgi:hypothetical protein